MRRFPVEPARAGPLLRIVAAAVLLLSGWSPVTAATGAPPAVEAPTVATASAIPVELPGGDQAFVRDQLEAAIRLYDRAFRVAATGQYLDAIDLMASPQPAGISSIAATGIGLISLAMADALGIDPHAAEKAEVTLSSLLGTDPRSRFRAARSASGWFEQYIDATTGAATADHVGKYSTIDTTLLAIGAVFVGRHFEQTGAPEGSAGFRVAELSRRLVGSIRWESAIRDMKAGQLHALLLGPNEDALPGYWGESFDEYVLIPCLGRAVEQRAGVRGPMSEFWERHLAHIDRLPTKPFANLKVLSRTTSDFVSHFTHQFAFYLCGSLGRSSEFQQALAELRAADRYWFASRSVPYPTRWWGIGAGSALIRTDRTRTSATELYVASTLDSTDDGVFSPPIMAGFLMLDALEEERRPVPGLRSPTLAELRALFARGECRYEYGDLRFLWRCSAHDPFARLRFLQGIDFSTYMLGMATLVPEIGLGFYRRSAP